MALQNVIYLFVSVSTQYSQIFYIYQPQIGLGAVSALVLCALTWYCGCWEEEMDEWMSQHQTPPGKFSNKGKTVLNKPSCVRASSVTDLRGRQHWKRTRGGQACVSLCVRVRKLIEFILVCVRPNLTDLRKTF